MNDRPRATDPAHSRTAIALGLLLVALTLACCLITLLGWTRGAFSLVGPG